MWIASSSELIRPSLSRRTASATGSPVPPPSKTFFMSVGSLIAGRSASGDAPGSGAALEPPPPSAPAILSSSPDFPSPPPQADSASAAATASETAGKERRFTMDSP